MQQWKTLFDKRGGHRKFTVMTPPIFLHLVRMPAALFVAGFAMFALTAPLAAQQTYTWDSEAGTNNATRSWGNLTNWVNNPSPLTFTNTTDIIFAQASITNNAPFSFLGANRTIRSLTFGAGLVGGLPGNDLYDIRLHTNGSGAGSADLIFSAASGNASITVAQSTDGISQIRLGNGGAGTIVLDSNLDLAQNNTFLTNVAAFQLGNSITGTGTINKTGAGVVSVVRDNSGWSGGMNINEGEVRIYSSNNAMGTGTWTLGGGTNNTVLTVGSPGIYTNSGGLVVEGGGGTRTIANLSFTSSVGTPTLAGAITLSNDVIFNIGNYGANQDRMTVSGAIGGIGGLTKSGTGSLVLSASNTYGGTTTVSAGSLIIGASGSVASSSVLDVASGATLNVSAVSGGLVVGSGQMLRGSGSVVGNTTINGALQPGNSPGVLSFNNDLTLGGTAVTTMEIDGAGAPGTAFDAINVVGVLTYDGTLTLSLGTSFGFGNYSFDLFNSSSTAGSFDTVGLDGSYSGSFINNAGVWGLTNTSGPLTNTWTFTESSGLLALEVVPEPSTYALLVLAATGLGALVVRRRRSA